MTNYSIQNSPTGVTTFFDSDTGEYLHRFFGPEHESSILYAGGCKIEQRSGELCICDLGLGAGFNVFAALKQMEHNKKLTQARIYSFDTTLHGLKLLLANIELFEFLSCYKNIVRNALHCFEAGAPENRKVLHFTLGNRLPVEWVFYRGDARVNICKIEFFIKFHAIFFDFFSCQKTEELWLRDSFALFSSKLAQDGMLATYSTATPVRAILLSLGLFVGEGPKVSNSLKGTLASPDHAKINEALDMRWKERFSRSQRKFFLNETPENKEQIEKSIRDHRQFHIE